MCHSPLTLKKYHLTVQEIKGRDTHHQRSEAGLFDDTVFLRQPAKFLETEHFAQVGSKVEWCSPLTFVKCFAAFQHRSKWNWNCYVHFFEVLSCSGKDLPNGPITNMMVLLIAPPHSFLQHERQWIPSFLPVSQCISNMQEIQYRWKLGRCGIICVKNNANIPRKIVTIEKLVQGRSRLNECLLTSVFKMIFTNNI